MLVTFCKFVLNSSTHSFFALSYLGIQILWAAQALEIAQTTCNRDIYALMEAPVCTISSFNCLHVHILNLTLLSYYVLAGLWVQHERNRKMGELKSK